MPYARARRLSAAIIAIVEPAPGRIGPLPGPRVAAGGPDQARNTTRAPDP